MYLIFLIMIQDFHYTSSAYSLSVLHSVNLFPCEVRTLQQCTVESWTMWELGTLALCMVENLCITDSWPSVFMVPLHREFIQPCRTVIFNMEKPMCKWTHAIQTSIVKGPTLLLFLPSFPLSCHLVLFFSSRHLLFHLYFILHWIYLQVILIFLVVKIVLES